MTTNNEKTATSNAPETAHVREQGANVAPKARKASKKATAGKGATAAKKAAKASKPAIAKPAPKKDGRKLAAKKTAKAEGDVREGSKKAEVLAMIQKKGGATLDAIMKCTGWQKHTVRGFMSVVPKKLGLNLRSERIDGKRTYFAA